MTLPIPNLDDRTSADLVLEARDRIARSCPDWTDLSAHDPGITLIETFAHLTEVLLHRLNRLPDKAYIEFLNLLGVTRRAPAAAWTELTFTRTGDDPGRITIPAGTRATAQGADPRPVVFVTTEPVVLGDGQASVTVRAHHCEPVAAELLGLGTGLPGQVLRTARAPIATTTEHLDVTLGVQALAGEVTDGVPVREHDGRTFVIWQPVAGFAGVAPGAQVYQLDRGTGTVTFAPALDAAPVAGGTPVAAVPAVGREVRLWYRVGGGAAGNVAAHTVTALADPVPGVRVDNEQPASGGRDLEPVDAALTRGPQEFFTLRRAVTARDFELLATAASAAVARATASTRSTTWSFAQPGEVEVVLVPHVGAESRPGWRLPAAQLRQAQREDVRLHTQQDLDAQRTIGTRVVTGWARYKPVSVRARVVVGDHEDVDAVRQRITDRLYATITPLPTPVTPTGWAFGEPLHVSNVHRMLESADPAVRYVDDVRFVLDEAPSGSVRSVVADRLQAGTWYAGCGEVVFRSANDGAGWEPAGRFPQEEVRRVLAAPQRPGLVSAATRTADGNGVLYVSHDLAETWTLVATLEPAIADIAWIDRDGVATLLCATDTGLYEVPAEPGAVPVQVLVDNTDADRGFYGVRSFVSERGVHGVALAAQAKDGVYLSTDGGTPGTFKHVGLRGVDTRTIEVQYDGPNTVLWIGTGESDPSRPGQGCHRARMFEADVRWVQLSAGWTGGTCWDLDFAGGAVLAATQSAGVLRLDPAAATPQWEAANVTSGLPLRDRTRFEPVATLAAGGAVLAGGPRGVYRSDDTKTWQFTAERETREPVTIPPTWLLCSGGHDVEVVRTDATAGH